VTNVLPRVPETDEPALPVSRPLSRAAEATNGPNIYEICIFVCECADRVWVCILADICGMLIVSLLGDKRLCKAIADNSGQRRKYDKLITEMQLCTRRAMQLFQIVRKI